MVYAGSQGCALGLGLHWPASFSVHIFHSRAEFRYADFLGHQFLHLPVFPTSGIDLMNQESIFPGDQHPGNRSPQQVREAFVGFDISRKRDSFGVPAWPGFRMLDQQRTVRAKAKSSVSSAQWIWRLWLPLLWKLSRGSQAGRVRSPSPYYCPICNKMGWQGEFSFQRIFCLVA